MVRLISNNDPKKDADDSQAKPRSAAADRTRRGPVTVKRDEAADVAEMWIDGMHGCAPSARRSRAGCADYPRHR